MHQKDSGHMGYVEGSSGEGSGENRWVSTGPRRKIPVANISLGADLACIVSGTIRVYTFDRTDGSLRWQYEFPPIICSTPAVSGDRGVIAVDPPEESVIGLRAFDVSDGAELWTNDDVSPDFEYRPTTDDGRIYTASGGDDPSVDAVDVTPARSAGRFPSTANPVRWRSMRTGCSFKLKDPDCLAQ